MRGGSAEPESERDGCGGEAVGARDIEGDSDGGGERERFQSRAEMTYDDLDSECGAQVTVTVATSASAASGRCEPTRRWVQLPSGPL